MRFDNHFPFSSVSVLIHRNPPVEQSTVPPRWSSICSSDKIYLRAARDFSNVRIQVSGVGIFLHHDLADMMDQGILLCGVFHFGHFSEIIKLKASELKFQRRNLGECTRVVIDVRLLRWDSSQRREELRGRVEVSCSPSSFSFHSSNLTVVQRFPTPSERCRLLLFQFSSYQFGITELKLKQPQFQTRFQLMNAGQSQEKLLRIAQRNLKVGFLSFDNANFLFFRRKHSE